MKITKARKEIYRNIVGILSICFFAFLYGGIRYGQEWMYVIAFLSLFIAVFLVFWGQKKGLEPDYVKKRWENLNNYTPLITKVSYGAIALMIILSVFVSRKDPKNVSWVVVAIIGIIMVIIIRLVTKHSK